MAAEDDAMPMYDFECTACGHIFETIAKYEELPPCPECNGVTQRLMGAPLMTGQARIEWKEKNAPDYKTRPGRPNRR